MIWIPNDNNDPTFNLAAEEYILSELRPAEEILFFFIDQPSIIVGRHQNTREEINPDFVRDHGIQVVRRLSGGGAVYHDFGNLCFSFIFPDTKRPVPDFARFTAPIVATLNRLGIPAQLSGRNDITVDGAKISGNAYYHNQFGSVCHGTLLFDSDLGMLSQALRPHQEKIAAKGIQSVRSRVLNLREKYLPEMHDVQALREKIIAYMADTRSDFSCFNLTEADLERIHSLAEKRYRSDAWNYGESPKYNHRSRQRFPFGEIDARLWVEDGIIHEIRFFGDFFTPDNPAEIESVLSNVSFEREAITKALQQSDLENTFPNLSLAEFTDFLISRS